MPASETLSTRNRWIGPGLFLNMAGLLMLEVGLTRIFSVVMWYHFAFFAISVALFGLAASGLIVYLLPSRFRPDRALSHAFAGAIGLSVAAPLCFLALAANPGYRHLTSFAGGQMSLEGLVQLGALYLTGTVPFFFAGVVPAVLFRRYGEQASRLYFYDLAGAAVGCAATLPVLDHFGGPGAMTGAAALAALAAFCFACAEGVRGRAIAALALTAAAVVVTVVNPATGWLQLRYFRGREAPKVLHEKWNSFSRVSVRDFGSADSLLIEIDAASNTIIRRWDGDPERMRPLLDDLIAVPYALLEAPNVLVIGSGGGVDLLAAAADGARSVTAVEVNPIIVDVMRGKFSEYSGGVYRRPEVRVVTDEARSYIRRSGEKYDLIQAGYVDTYAATAAGAFALTENTLYTKDAYRDYFAHLAPEGIVAIQRYYEEPPQQSIRLISLALAALRERGDPEPSRHVFMARKDDRATVLVKNSPFHEAQIARLREHCARAGLEVVAAPDARGVGIYGELLAAPDPDAVIAAYPFDISAVDDDRPFYFYVVKPAQFWKGLLVRGGEKMNSRAVFLITALLLGSLVLCAILATLPAILRPKALTPAALPAMGYFACLGLGFMLVEIGMLQRLMLFLGHPTLALSVVLTSILLSSGLGAWWSRRIDVERSLRGLGVGLALVLAAVLVIALAWPQILYPLVGLERPIRIALAVAFLFPVGFLLGMPFPLGIRRLATGSAEWIPWAWGVNGATSVLGSILAMVVAINNGFTATLLLGGACYALALILAAPAFAPRARATLARPAHAQ